jgi:hypothetical protein
MSNDSITLSDEEGRGGARRAAVRRDRLARDDIHPVSSDLGDLGVAIALDWQLR